MDGMSLHEIALWDLELAVLGLDSCLNSSTLVTLNARPVAKVAVHGSSGDDIETT